MKRTTQKIYPFLMFSGQAEEAMNLYTSIFDETKIISITRYEANEAGLEGTILHAVFSLLGQEFMCLDSNVKQPFTFTPALSLYVSCNKEEDIERYFSKLSQGGSVLMPLTSYPFNEKFGWVQDKFGVSWQLSLNKNE
ncbi:MAG: VOC family protein [Ignavibacteriales bacterium]